MNNKNVQCKKCKNSSIYFYRNYLVCEKCGAISYRKKNKLKIYYLLFISLFFIFMSGYVNAFNLISNNEPSGTILGKKLYISFNITTDEPIAKTYLNFQSESLGIDDVYDIFDDYFKVYYNLNNFSTLGENSTIVYDISLANQNGTVYGGAVYTPNGRYNGAYYFNGFNSYILTNVAQITNNNFSIAFWVKAMGNTSNVYGHVFGLGNLSSQITMYRTTTMPTFNLKFSNFTTLYDSGALRLNASNNIWNHFVITYDGEYVVVYENGQKKGSILRPGGLNWEATRLTIGSGVTGYNYFNGTIDEFILINRSIGDKDARVLYESYFIKKNQTLYFTAINKSIFGANSTYPKIDFLYWLCAQKKSGIGKCSKQTQINNTIHNAFINSSFQNKLGKVREDFYGVNEKKEAFYYGYDIDTNCDNILETNVNSSTVKFFFLKGKNKNLKVSSSTRIFYKSLNNFDFEDWTNISIGKVNKSQESGSRDWYLVVEGGRNATIYQTNDKYSGTYALALNSSAGTGSLYLRREIALFKGDVYNFSIWAKGQGIMPLKITNSSGQSLAEVNITLTSSYAPYSIFLNYSGINITGYIVIGNINNNANITIDYYNVKRNGQDYRFWYIGEFDSETHKYLISLREVIRFSKENNFRLLIGLGAIPNTLSNWSSNCRKNMTDASTYDCLPYDYRVWEDMLNDFIIRTTDLDVNTLRNIDFEFWNEPYGSSFLSELPYDSEEKANYYYYFYNITYNKLKSISNYINVGGPCGYIPEVTPNIFRVFFINASNQYDFITWHPYETGGKYYENNRIDAIISNLLDYCSLYSGNCNRIISTEWQPTAKVMKNQSNGQSDEYRMDFAKFYISFLKTIPNNSSHMYYKLFEKNSYFNCPTYYPEYPSFWTGVSFAGLDNPTTTYYPPFNITKDFSILCGPNFDVYDAYSNDNDLEAISCISANGKLKSLIIINKANEGKNLTFYFSDSFRNYFGGEIVEDGYIIDNYGLLFLYSGTFESNENIKINNPFCNDFPSYLVMFVFFMIITFVIMIFLSNPNNVNNIIAILSAIVALLIVFAFISIFIESICS